MSNSNIKRDIALEMHKPARINFPKRHVKLLGIGDLIQMDLIVLDKYKKYNKNYSYILLIIDCFSKYVFTYPLKTKSAVNMMEALKKFFIDYNKKYSKVKIHHIQTDQGTEFYNAQVAKLFKDNNVNHYSSYSPTKAQISERCIRTIKRKLFIHFSVIGAYKWIDILEKITNEYNNSYHRTIKMKPSKVSLTNQDIVLQNIKNSYPKTTIKNTKLLKIGTHVRISKVRHPFSKGYTPNWSAETFTIYDIRKTSSPPVYYLQDSTGNKISGGFYKEELNPTKHKDIFLIEKVLKRTRDKFFVKWLGFLEPTWILKKDII